MIDFEKLDNDYQVIYNSDGWGSLILERKEQSVFNMLEKPNAELKKLTVREAIELSKTIKIPITSLANKENKFFKEMTKICIELNA